jgi:PHD/YefM family antitoxin component YafN of YafNO toxin-antitoxin module
MKNSQLDRLLRFAQRTGDRLIITDSEGKQPVVILSLDEYEALLDGGKTAPPAARQPISETEEDETVDLAGIEAAVEAVNREATPEPKVVPITRKSQPSEPGEEQFYMEPL